ncbi:Protein CROWDED NUCLEI 1 [Linum perenne]
MMSTPQRTSWSEAQKSGLAYRTPNSMPMNPSKIGGDGSRLRGKAVDIAEAMTPHGVPYALNDKDLPAKISRLENELYEYQYNMGILIMEKKCWSDEFDELKQVLTDTTDRIKREQAAHLIAISDAEKQEASLRDTLGVEKHCVVDLEKAVQEMHAEIAEMQSRADSKLSDANTMVSSVEENYLDVEAQQRAIEARLAEVSRKSSELVRKSQEVDSLERSLRLEGLSVVTGKEAHDTTFSKQREEFREWERKLEEEEQRLSSGLRSINQRDEKECHNDKIFKQKMKDSEEAQMKIDEANSILSRKEHGITTRQAKLIMTEKEFVATKDNLQLKEKELQILAEKLNERENVELPKLLSEHNTILDAKRCEFELEAEERSKVADEELKSRVVDLEKKEVDIKHMEEKVAKREQALDKKLEKLKDKENDFESKSEDLMVREKATISEYQALEGEKRQVQDEKVKLLNIKAELENIKAANEQQLQNLCEEKEQLQISEDERSEYVRLQSELKDELERCRFMEEQLLKEADDLKLQKENFEREWDELDEKKAEIEREKKSLSDEKEKFEKQKQLVEERIKRDRTAMNDYIKRELESLDLAKESFKENLEHERKIMEENAESEKDLLLHEIELQKSELENRLQKLREEMDKNLQEKMRLFEDERQRESEKVNLLRDVARREKEDMILERSRIEKDRKQLDENKKHLQEQQLEMHKDINKLGDLSRKLKKHREQFIKEKDSFVEQRKGCSNCEGLTFQFMLSGDDNTAVSASRQALGAENCNLAPERLESEKPPSSHRVSPVSWLQKCTTRLFNLSPHKRVEFVEDLNEGAPDTDKEEPSNKVDVHEDEQELSLAYRNDLRYDQMVHSCAGVAAAADNLSLNDPSNINSGTLDMEEVSQPSDLKHGPGHYKRRAKVIRTHSVKSVIADAKVILGEPLEPIVTEDSSHLISESHEESSLADDRTQRIGRKRNRRLASQTTAESEGHSDSITASKYKKSRAGTAVQAPAETRYNLRRSKRAAVGIDVAQSELNKENEEETKGVVGSEDGNVSRDADKLVVTKHDKNEQSVQIEEVAEHMDDETNTETNLEMSQEVSGRLVMDEENGTPGEYSSRSGREDEGEDEEYEHPGEASVGKKLWTFFTT